jgi:flagellar protein FlbD
VIELTRLNGDRFILNADLIQYVETLPDTYITLTSGERVVVQETMDEVVALAVEYQRGKWLVPPPAPPRAW